MTHPRTLIILPAFNEEGNIGRVIGDIRQSTPWADIVVIDDGSVDATATCAREAGARVLTLPYNVGIGAAVQTGLQFAHRHGYEVVIRNDGDGQHAPEDIPHMIDRLQQGDVDMVVGSRFLGQSGDYGTSLSRKAGIQVISRLLRIVTGYPITDPTSGFCAFNQRAIQLFARLYPHDYPEPESIVMLHLAGLNQCEIAVTMRAREHGESSITPVRSAYYMFKVILAILINLLRRPPVIDK